ncbi:hypothetical protein [Celeribacter sp. SCSIO 80788]|uniref:hypothetical protein n=1 Tax=Celeribacter sp. SCSIO 80788 TaxID=3117013 RepID=UPI003DA57C90
MRFTSLSLRRRAVLMGTSALLLSAPAAVAQDATVLDPILILGEDGQIHALEGSDEGVGATALDADAIVIRGDGSGDANTALTTLPHVQGDPGDTDDAGANIDDVLDLQPKELSISGGSLTENTFLLNGVDINSVTGTTHPGTSTDLNREDNQPNTYAFYGLHSQTQFVPSSLLEEAEVLDSDVSAEYGGFQGGVVKYELKKPNPEKAEGSVTVNYSSSDLTDYTLATEDGENPNDMIKPSWTKIEYAYDYNQPLSERSALRFGYSRRSAEGTKAKEPQYLEDTVDSDSRSDFYSLAYSHDFLNGDTLTLSGQYTDYDQDWDSNYVRDFHLDVKTQSLSLDAKYEKDWDALSIAGVDLKNAKLTLRAIHQDSTSSNGNPQNEYYNWYGSYRGGFYTDAFDEWCDADETGSESVLCRTGGLGSTDYSDVSNRLEAKFESEIWNGRLSMGAAIEQVEAKRSGSGFTFYSSTTRLSDDDAFDAFICADGDSACIEDEYFSVRIYQEAYDVEIEALAAETYAELEQTWGDFTLRAGLRADYNDVLENLDLAPRLTATWKPNDAFSLSMGANRYYSDSYLAYAIHDAVPRGLNQRRTHDSTTGEVGEWYTNSVLSNYYYTQGDLKTPYTDEISLTAMYRDHWTNGVWRLKGIHRLGKDQFAASEDSTSQNQTLTNDGSSEYTSVSLEYENNWEINSGALDSLGLYVSGVWADRDVSSNTYFLDDEGSLSFISYKGKSYSTAEFSEVTGNLDIPVRATLELRSTWKDERVKLGLGADITAGYNGVIDTDSNETLVHDTYGSQSHDIYEDYKFDTVVSTYLTAKVQIAKLQQGTATLDVKVSNLFNDIGNVTSTDDNPWVQGRSVYLGTTFTW